MVCIYVFGVVSGVFYESFLLSTYGDNVKKK